MKRIEEIFMKEMNNVIQQLNEVLEVGYVPLEKGNDSDDNFELEELEKIANSPNLPDSIREQARNELEAAQDKKKMSSLKALKKIADRLDSLYCQFLSIEQSAETIKSLREEISSSRAALPFLEKILDGNKYSEAIKALEEKEKKLRELLGDEYTEEEVNFETLLNFVEKVEEETGSLLPPPGFIRRKAWREVICELADDLGKNESEEIICFLRSDEAICLRIPKAYFDAFGIETPEEYGEEVSVKDASSYGRFLKSYLIALQNKELSKLEALRKRKFYLELE